MNGAPQSRRTPAFFRIREIAALAVVLLFAAPPVRAADPSALAEHQIKALYLFNFTKYVDWPADSFAGAGAPFTIGLLASPEINDDLREITRGKSVNGRKILVLSLEENAAVKGCQMIFIGGANAARIAPILHEAGAAAILTVGETEDFAARGGIVNFLRHDDRVRLEINLSAARRARLAISAKLLAVAAVVNGRPVTPR